PCASWAESGGPATSLQEAFYPCFDDTHPFGDVIFVADATIQTVLVVAYSKNQVERLARPTGGILGIGALPASPSFTEIVDGGGASKLSVSSATGAATTFAGCGQNFKTTGASSVTAGTPVAIGSLVNGGTGKSLGVMLANTSAAGSGILQFSIGVAANIIAQIAPGDSKWIPWDTNYGTLLVEASVGTVTFVATGIYAT
ncbi:MAG: hypothetical protein ACRDQZ_26550, partial [Mycobacteriales bacterium]